MRGTEIIRAIQSTLMLLTGFVIIYVLIHLNDPNRAGTGMWFLLIVMGLSIYFLAHFQKKMTVSKEERKQ
ncbi:hypothetical protein [Alkalicoccobacillus plakortidis]|uniref:YrhC-like protein n=1 Tax=Alkalicoccobacillus plakortidis TaxID=444060 RepID=A0ABT0XMD5_9BACI|nr:hypothetical protein [Alkalicoccobacillus plakortidis]MCM2676987.1 hypothetical protein [Alkalicoccobacillus plakortidis]